MPIKLSWAYEEGGVRHEPGDTVTLSSAEEKRLIAGRYAVPVEPEPEEEIPPADPEGEPTVPPAAELPDPEPEPEASKKKGTGRKGAADDES